MNTRIKVDDRGFLLADGVKVFRFANEREIQIYDPSAVRLKARGSQFIYISIEDLIKILAQYAGKDELARRPAP